MERKNYFIFGGVALVVVIVMCNWSANMVGEQAGTVALGYAVGEQAQANQEMARAMRTQANANVWIVGLVVGGMLGALVLGVVLGRGRAPQPVDALELRRRASLPTFTPVLPAHLIPPEQVLDELIGVKPYERRR
jgi:hypothetical protein